MYLKLLLNLLNKILKILCLNWIKIKIYWINIIIPNVILIYTKKNHRLICINNTCVGSPKCPEYEMVNGIINKCKILKYCDEIEGCIYKNVEDTDEECVESSKSTVSIFPIVSSILLGIVMLLILLCIIL